MAKTFILGVGAQRTGSTWLHSQLNQNDEINMGLCKEYHVFDVLFTPYVPELRIRLVSRVNEAGTDAESVRKERKLLSFLEDPNNYFTYFDRLSSRDHRTQAVGDMTPSYSMLDSEAYQFIRDGLVKRGFRVKVIFIMRDPIERIWSMFHQAAKVRQDLEAGKERRASITTFTNVNASLRTRYDRTITELEKVFPKADIFYDFYERFFTPESYSSLATFLSINLDAPDFQKRRNTSLMKGQLDDALAREAALHYSETYRFIRERFGSGVVDLWSGYKYL
jgi:hypothetical protein